VQPGPDPQIWLEIQHSDGKFTLYPGNKENILKDDGWLCDSEITAGQLLLKHQFSHVDGLRDSAIIGPLVTPVKSEFVQIINTGSHWVCLSNIGCSSGQINVFDSFRGATVKPVAIEHSCRMLNSPDSVVTMVRQKVQIQRNGHDCGLFALAFATELCHGFSPVTCSYDDDSLRSHLVQCLENQHMSVFPRTHRRVGFHRSANIVSLSSHVRIQSVTVSCLAL